MVCAVEYGSLNAYSVEGSLNYGVLLGVETTAYLLPFSRRDSQSIAQTSYPGTVGKFSRSTIIACRENPFVFDQDGSYLTP